MLHAAFRKTAAARAPTTTTPAHLVTKNRVKGFVVHLTPKFEISLDLFLVRLKGAWPALVSAETNYTTVKGYDGRSN